MGIRFSPTSRHVRPRAVLAVLVTATMAGCTLVENVADRLGGGEPMTPRPAPQLEGELPDGPRDVTTWIDGLLMDSVPLPAMVPNLDTGAPLPGFGAEARILAATPPGACPRMPTADLGTRDSMPTARLDSAGYPIRVAPLCDVAAR